MPRPITALKCRFCNRPTHYTHTALLVQPFPADQQPVENCSISCEICLDSAKEVLKSVLDIPLDVLLDSPMHEPGSLLDLYHWEKFSFQQLYSVIHLAKQQKQREDEELTLSR